MLALDITQFFPSLNHCLILLILRKAVCDTKISLFFSNYSVDMKTCYSQNGFNSSFFSADIGVGQGSALSPILFALFITPIFHIFKKTKYSCFLSFICRQWIFHLSGGIFYQHKYQSLLQLQCYVFTTKLVQTSSRIQEN